MQRYYYFFIYLLWLAMALSLHDAHAGPHHNKDTTPNPFYFTDQTGVGLATVVTSNTITVGGSDEIRYRIAGLSGASYQVAAELIHQPLAYGFAQDLFNDSGAEIQDFRTMFQASNAKSTTITTHSFSVAR
jgi:hypothetical protein